MQVIRKDDVMGVLVGLVGCVIDGERLHMNNAESYLNTLNSFSKTN